MTSALRLAMLLATTSLLSACSTEGTHQITGGGLGRGPANSGGGDTTEQMTGVVSPTETLPVDDAFKPTPQQTLDYMRYIGPSLIGRVLSDEEETKLAAGSASAIKPIIET